ncbi:FecR family protein [Chitinophaga skermanii]|uniref:FecR family protein n=1 Tax=Chitinophaga skermanii TaxID=331697 RepID=A0A327QX17_9BACT|nr:FecR family protein [Chitinophaga skermanii]RAJ08881.1 FecR family protein [Chitinophaga skermanii]
MIDVSNRITELVYRFLNEEISESELEELAEWQAADPLHKQLFDEVIEQHHLQEGMRAGFVAENARERVFERIQQHKKQTGKVVYLKKYKWIVAAAIVLVLSIPSLLLLQERTSTSPSIVTTGIHPATNKATLTLADGSTIELDSNGNRQLKQGNTTIQQQGGQLAYNSQADASSIAFNTLSTPRGGQFRVQLPDGSQAWLNAASSITYPTAFAGKERRVKVTGEVYFEVAKNATMPFIVNANTLGEVEVLGTHFNINAYKDEPTIQTTLLEGKVRVKGGGNSTLLLPNQQAILQAHSLNVVTVSEEKIHQIMAWKNGIFNFENQSLEQIMKQVSRWYDIDVKYANSIPNIEFFGELGREVSLQELLHFLEKSGVKFKLDAQRKELTVF